MQIISQRALHYFSTDALCCLERTYAISVHICAFVVSIHKNGFSEHMARLLTKQ